jgi:hypothetical protein
MHLLNNNNNNNNNGKKIPATNKRAKTNINLRGFQCIPPLIELGKSYKTCKYKGINILTRTQYVRTDKYTRRSHIL